MKRAVGCLAIILLVGLVLTSAVAQVVAPLDLPSLALKGSDEPLEITAKQTRVRSISGGTEAIFEGNVKLQQSDLILTCDRLSVMYNQKDGKKTAENRLNKLPKQLQPFSMIQSITASGNVRMVQGDRSVEAEKVVLDPIKGTVIVPRGPR